MSRVRTLLGLIAAAVTTIAAVACDDAEERTIEAELLAPPLVPERVDRRPAHVVVNLEVIEKEVEIAPGVTYMAWTFNGSVPGPLIRVRVGDTVEVNMKNAGTTAHNIDLHAVTGPGGGAEATTANAGETKGFTFKAKSPGLYMYHCAAGVVSDHIANGMWGGILVDGADALPPVDHEFYVGQGDMYTSGETGEPGSQDLDMTRLLAEQPTYVMFNGHSKGLIDDRALQARVGEKVRIYFVNGGPNLTSSFHVIGEIFDRAWNWGSISTGPVEDVQTITVPPGGATVVDFDLNVPGDYKLVDHALGRLAKGAVGTLAVTGPEDLDVFNGHSIGGGGHDMTAPTRTPASGTPAPGTNGAATSTVQVTMKDNLFEPAALRVKSGEKVKFELKNDGKLPHNMQIANSAGAYDTRDATVSRPEIIAAGRSGSLEWQVPSTAGTFAFRCDIHPTEMVGTITVE